MRATAATRPSRARRLHAARVTLRPIKSADASALFGLFSDREVTRYWSRPPMTHLGQARRSCATSARAIAAARACNSASSAGATASLVGTCTLFHFQPGKPARRNRLRARRGVLGPGLHARSAAAAAPAYAFDELDLYRLEADIDPRNAASARTLARLGFVKEGLPARALDRRRRDLRHRGLRTAQARVGAADDATTGRP